MLPHWKIVAPVQENMRVVFVHASHTADSRGLSQVDTPNAE